MQQAFPPIARSNAKVVVLGTGPSRVSLEKQEYYGHPTNAFWPLMHRLFADPIDTYEEKIQLLLRHRIALWDTLCRFEREGSLDCGYRKVEPNDLVPFLKAHESVQAVAFTGKKAQEFYRRFIAWYPPEIVFCALPSPSAANTMPFAQKERAYRTFFARFLDVVPR